LKNCVNGLARHPFKVAVFASSFTTKNLRQNQCEIARANIAQYLAEAVADLAKFEG
jgi:hypothetical protein